jgi:hypothetical protein
LKRHYTFNQIHLSSTIYKRGPGGGLAESDIAANTTAFTDPALV